MQRSSHSILSTLAAGSVLSALLLALPATAQTDLSSRLRPIIAKVKNAGTLHLGTGTWTRAHGDQEFLGTSDFIVYANTCDSGYYVGQAAGEVWTDEGSIPDGGQVQTPSPFIPGSNDTDTGCFGTLDYDVSGFQVAYCTFQTLFTANVDFYDNYEPVGTTCAVPGTPIASFALSGLPASPATGTQSCWLVAFDINGAGNFTLTGTGTNPNLFGWSFAVTSPVSVANPDGPLLAGRPSVCSGTDATRWDGGFTNLPAFPANYTPGGQGGVLPAANEEGTGMLTLDAIRVDGANPGCFFFGGNPFASMHLELYSDVSPCPVCLVGFCGGGFCFGDTSCPCGMFPTTPGAGCNNESNTGGAVLSATGNASVSADSASPSVFLALNNAPPFKTSVFIQGTVTIAAVPFGDGQRCVSGSLVRLNAPPPPPPPGDPTDANGSLIYPTANHPLSITLRSQQAGQPINAGDTRHYFAQYRDPSPNACNVSLGGTVNTSQAITLVWSP